MSLGSLKASWVYRKLHPRFMFQSLRPTMGVFDDIYKNNKWGGEKGELYSGSGSRGDPAQAYIDTIKKYISENGIRRVVDLGCGDFFIGQEIAKVCQSYIGVDISSAVIDHNRTVFGSDSIEFLRANIVTDELPKADLCLVRQVFQHLSNKQIREALVKLRVYPHVIVTEHYPNLAEFTAPNLDKSPGVGTRVAYGSSVCLDKPPFSISTAEMLSVPASPRKDGLEDIYTRGSIKTFSLSGR